MQMAVVRPSGAGPRDRAADGLCGHNSLPKGHSRAGFVKWLIPGMVTERKGGKVLPPHPRQNRLPARMPRGRK